MFVFPMAGLSSRFTQAGYTRPKHELPLFGQTVFANVVRSFALYFDTDPFIFIHRDSVETAAFLRRELDALGVRDVRLMPLDAPTDGQARTVRLGLQGLREVPPDEPLFIFNVDTLRPGFRKPDFVQNCDGYLEVFQGVGEHWSFAVPGPDGTVLRTAEKTRISDLCSDGLYHFRRKADFERIFDQAVATDERTRGEFYVAPLYNRLIAEGARIRYDIVSPADLLFCGTPAEYEALRVNEAAYRRLDRLNEGA